MRRTVVLRATALAFALVIGMAPGVAADRPDTGDRDIQLFAQANLDEDLGECTVAKLAVSFAAGDNLQNPIGSGKPGSWSDVELRLQIYDFCTDTELAFFQGIGLHPPEIVPFTSALVTGVETDLFRSTTESVHVWVDLYWTGDGKPAVRTENSDGYVRVERFVPAVVTGQVVVGPNALWGTALTFTSEADDGNSLGWAAEIQTTGGPSSAGGDPFGFAGVWTAVDCATWWEATPDGNVVDCDVWGDGSTITLAVGRGAKPHVVFTDTYSKLCAIEGLPASFSGFGRGTFEEPSGMWIHVDTACGSVPQGWLDLYRDPGSDTLWWDHDGDGWGWVLTRLH